jgi:hypothetical protein
MLAIAPLLLRRCRAHNRLAPPGMHSVRSRQWPINIERALESQTSRHAAELMQEEERKLPHASLVKRPTPRSNRPPLTLRGVIKLASEIQQIARGHPGRTTIDIPRSL